LQIAAAANVAGPAYLALRDKGFDATHSDAHWIAVRGDLRFIADSPIQLLGVVTVFEARGEAWKASDEDIDAFLVEFPGS